MASVGDNIRRLRKAKGWKIIDLANRTGSDVGNISRLERGKQGYSDEQLRRIAKALGVSISALFDDLANISPAGEHQHTMPLISWVNAGAWLESPDQFQPGDAEDWLPRPRNAGPRSFALRVEGDSMTSPYPGQRSYPAGSIIFVDPDKPVTNGARVVAKTEDGYFTFKVYAEDAGRRYLKPINTQYEPIPITEGSSICGVVIGTYLPE